MSFLSRWLGIDEQAPPSAAPAPSAAPDPSGPQKPPAQAAEASPKAAEAVSAPSETHALLVEIELEVARFLGHRQGKLPFLINELRKRL